MKCEHVQSVMVEYVEGALCVADELCVDIHLVQCELCRADLHATQGLGAILGAALDHAKIPADPLMLLDRLDSLPAMTPSRPRFSGHGFGGPALRAAVVAGAIAFALAAGAIKWPSDLLHPFGMLPVEAAGQQSLVETIRPLSSASELRELRDLDQLAGQNLPAVLEVR